MTWKVRASDGRWETTLGSFVAERGVDRLVDDLRAIGVPTTPQSVYHWIACRRMPRRDAVTGLVRISDGRLRLEDIYGHSNTRNR